MTGVRRYWIVLALIVLIAGFLRLTQLHVLPPGLSWDEAAIMYDAWGLADWNRDQYANFLPLHFKSFGDYKAPLTIYLLGMWYKLVGLDTEALRILSAVAGIVVVFAGYGIARQLAKIEKLDTTLWPLLATLGIALSPWLIHTSRIGLEAGIALMLMMLGLWGVLVAGTHFRLGVIGVSGLMASMYTYHSAKMVVPIVLLVTLLYLLKKAQIHLSQGLILLLVAGLLSIPLMRSSLTGGNERAVQSLLLFNDDGSLAQLSTVVTQLGNQIVMHGNGFLWNISQENVRNSVPRHGIVYGFEVLGLVIGVFYLRKKSLLFFLLIGWVLAGMLPSLLSSGGPHAIRALMMTPSLQLVIAWGFWQLSLLVKPLHFTRGVLILVLGMYAINLFSFWKYYTSNEYMAQAANDFQYGYKEALGKASSLMKRASAMRMTDTYGQPYIYTLLYWGLTPEQFQQGALANVVFGTISSVDQPGIVYVGTPDEIDPTHAWVQAVIENPGSLDPIFVVAFQDKEEE